MSLSRKIGVWASAILVFLLFSGGARADLAPPTQYPPPCGAKLEEGCELCAGDFRNFEKCSRAMKAKGLVQKCRTGGFTAWNEVWCAPLASSGATSVVSASSLQEPSAGVAASSVSAPASVASSPPVSPKLAEKAGCAVSGPEGGGSGVLFFAALLFWRRRRGWRQPGN